jgi:hypothetical protein
MTWRERNVFERREPRVRVFWRTGWMQFPVYAPATSPGYRWPRYQSRIWEASFIFLVWLLRGLRLRLGWAQRGRAVTVTDMIAFHPGKPKRCLCRGEGIITSWRGKERGVQFCAAMLGAFRAKAGFRVVQTKRGPRWVAGFEPEKLVGEVRHG